MVGRQTERKLNILVLESRAVVRKQLQEADSPRSNQLGLFFFAFCWSAFVANLVVPVGYSFFPLLFSFSPSQSKITWDVIN